jgi:hypothetical protein
MQRAPGFLPDDPNLTKFQNVVRYMKQNPTYLEPNKWPEGMVILMASSKRFLGVTFVSIEKFENIPSIKSLFDEIDELSVNRPKVELICFLPSLQMPEEGKYQETARLFVSQQTPEYINQVIKWSIVNGWSVERPIPEKELN